MAEQPQIIVKPNATTKSGKGARNNTNLQAAFPHSPIFKEELTDLERKKAFEELVLSGKVINGNGLNSFSRDFEGAPNLEEVETGGAGLPASPYVPNLASPGPGSFNAADQPVYAGELPEKEYRNQFGTGKGGLVSPSETSVNISKQGTLKTYISGKSYQGSDGKA